MLNISNNTITQRFDTSRYKSLKMIQNPGILKALNRWILFFFGLALVTLFLPWTQNINSKGYVTTIKPEQRPQTVNSVIGGQILTWYVQEGDYVQKGDTIIHIAETKDEYFDPQFIERLKQQIRAKEMSVASYKSKVIALANQIEALKDLLVLKLEQAEIKLQQARFKVESDSIDVVAAETNFNIAKVQLERMENLYNDGLKSLTDFEKRQNYFQEAQAKYISTQNKLLDSRNSLINARIQFSTIRQEFRDKIAKSESDRFTAQSLQFSAEADLAKLDSKLSQTEVRFGMYFVLAPQNGFITQSIRSGIGETIKAGEEVVTIMPDNPELAVEMYIRPVDLPLIKVGQDVRFIFDGWPAFVFSGWPNVAYGTYPGRVVAMDRFISPNGYYRVLVAEDTARYEWPDDVRYGSGARAITLLNDVPLWYEVWRQINGFPPEYYTGSNGTNAVKKPKNGKVTEKSSKEDSGKK